MSHNPIRRVVPSVMLAAACVGLSACNSGDATVNGGSSTSSTAEGSSTSSSTSTGTESSSSSSSSPSSSTSGSSTTSTTSSESTGSDEMPTAPAPGTDPGRTDTLTTNGGWIVSGNFITFVYRSGTRYVVDTGGPIADPKSGTYRTGQGTLVLKDGNATWTGKGFVINRANVNRSGAGTIVDRTGVIAVTPDGSVACATDKKLAFVTSDGRRGNANTGGAIFVDASGKQTTVGKPGDQGRMIGRYSVCNVGGRSSVEAFDAVLFEFNSDKLSATGTAFVKAAATTIAPEVAGRTVRVVGHTDSKGTPAANLDLGMRRAKTVSNELKRLIPGLVTEVRSAGQTQPTAPNLKPDGSDNPDGRAMNRRVEISWKN